ncbi:MAG: cation:proton antiporter, partial [Chloroflexota bacterium]|nr:cation:proton antiporter [Chloroflexota bacterium]
MGELPLIVVFVIALGAALVMGAVARRLKQPPMVGYIVAGVVLGPTVLGVIAKDDQVRLLAQFGIAFLMFALGTQFPLAQLRKSYSRALVAAVLQVLATIAVIVVAAWFLRLSLQQAALLGVLISVSGDVVIIKVLSDRGELNTIHGRLAIAITLMQDVVIIPMAIVLPHIGEPLGNMLVAVAISVVPAVALLAVIYFLGRRLLPHALDHVARAGREFFLLTVVLLAVGMGLLMERFSLSFAIGAYFAGVIVSESNYDRQALSEVIPFRDIFTTFFFVGVGLMVDMRYVVGHPLIVLVIIPALMLGKVVGNAAVSFFLRYPLKASIMSALLLANIGEAAFLLAQIGRDRGVISAETFSQVVAGGIVSTVLTSLLVKGGATLIRLVERVRPLDQPREGSALPWWQDDPMSREMRLTDHVVVCGSQGVGLQIAATLKSHNVPYVLVEPDPAAVARLQAEEIPVVFGDAANPDVLSQARVSRARMLVIADGDFPTTRAIVRAARSLNRKVEVVAPWPDGVPASSVSALGVTRVVRPDFEVSQQFVRHIMRDYGLDDS